METRYIMTINVNNQPRPFLDNGSVNDLIEQLGIAPNGIAIAINNMVIRKEQWVATQLKDNDNVTIIQATQGG